MLDPLGQVLGIRCLDELLLLVVNVHEFLELLEPFLICSLNFSLRLCTYLQVQFSSWAALVWISRERNTGVLLCGNIGHRALPSLHPMLNSKEATQQLAIDAIAVILINATTTSFIVA